MINIIKEVRCLHKRILVMIAVILLLWRFASYDVTAAELSVNRNYTTYKVVYGDNLSRIAHKFNTTVANLKSLNKLSSSLIYAGQSLKVPSSANVSILYYTVQSGDSLWAIANRLGVTIGGIKANNGLTSDRIYVGQILKIVSRNPVTTVNYRVDAGDTLWGLSQKYNTSVDAISKSNYMKVNYLMLKQTITIPLNSTHYVKPIGISMLRRKKNMYYGDIYTWDVGKRLFTVGTRATAMDLATGAMWNIRYYGGSNHADIEPLTKTDTNTMCRVFGYNWSWANKRPIVLIFSQGGIKYQIAASLIGMPHGNDAMHIADNGMAGHCCLYFYNSVGHSLPEVDPACQRNVLKANGQ